MYFIRVLDKKTDKQWKEEFYDYEIFRKRFYRLKYSKRLVVTSRSLLEWEQ